MYCLSLSLSIHIYMYRQRERARERFICMCTYTYIHTSYTMHTCTGAAGRLAGPQASPERGPRGYNTL